MATARCRLDHITVTAPDLARGVHYVTDALGVPMQPGGAHAQMATHNCLLRLGDAVYLEVIAPDPAAPRPARRRWFDLDEQTPATLPRLATWVVRSHDIRATAAAASEPLGDIVALQRGALRWSMTVTHDGSLVLAGAAPLVIEWQGDGKVASRLDDVGCTLRRLVVFHPERDRVARLLASIGIDDAAVIALADLPDAEPPYLIAEIDTPDGLRQLGEP